MDSLPALVQNNRECYRNKTKRAAAQPTLSKAFHEHSLTYPWQKEAPHEGSDRRPVRRRIAAQSNGSPTRSFSLREGTRQDQPPPQRIRSSYLLRTGPSGLILLATHHALVQIHVESVSDLSVHVQIAGFKRFSAAHNFRAVDSLGRVAGVNH